MSTLSCGIGLIVDDPAQRARREDVCVDAVNLVGTAGVARKSSSRLHLGGVDIGHDQLRPFLYRSAQFCSHRLA